MLPIIFLLAEKDPGFSYHALDLNPAIVFHLVEEDILAEHLSGLPDELPMRLIGSEQLTVRPGITAMHLLFGDGAFIGEAQGVQIGLVNVTDGHTSGLQIGLVNSTQSLAGVQIGLLNFAWSQWSIPIINIAW